MNQNNAEKQYKCNTCGGRFRTKKSLCQHAEATGHPAGESCRVCGRWFASERDLEQHFQSRKGHAKALKKKLLPPAKLRQTTAQQSTASSSQGTNASNRAHAGSVPLIDPDDLNDTALFEAGEKLDIKELLLAQVEKALNSTQQVPAKPPTMLKFSYLGNNYSTLAAWEAPAVLEALKDACHPARRLQEMNYPGFGNEDDPTDGENCFEATPMPDGEGMKRKVVVLDCEMVGVQNGRSELAFLSAVDFLTGEVLINDLVAPTQWVHDWRTPFSGITAREMSAAILRNAAIAGWPAAREELWKFIDSDTILIGQSLQFDLQALHISHPRIVDSAILVSEAVFGTTPKIRRMWGLKQICKEFFGLQIQTNSKLGHDGLEDTLAARELVLWCLRNPISLDLWALQKRASLPTRSRRPKASGMQSFVTIPDRENEWLDNTSDDCNYESPDELWNFSDSPFSII
jgi:DNA polymerase III epsilon subunit-like protein